MPCTPPKARALLKVGKAHPKRNKLGLFYVHLTYEQEPDNQTLVVGGDPGSKFEGYSVVGSQETVLNLMVEAPTHVKAAMEARRRMRRARRKRRWRRPAHNQNRLAGQKRLPPSTRSRWEAKARVLAHLGQFLPIQEVVIEDVQAQRRPGTKRKWNASFSPVQMGKQHLSTLLLAGRGLVVHLREGWQTKALREQYRLTKTRSKAQAVFASHAVDAWVVAASVSRAAQPTCQRLWYVVPARLHRRQLHRLEPGKGGIRSPYGGTRSFGLKRGTLVRHPRYGLCTIGGYDRARGTVSLHAYRTNQRLTQGGRLVQCQRLTWLAWRSWLVSSKPTKTRRKKGGAASSPALKRGVSAAQN